ncbi:MAG: response regulator [Deltaproteobacteria bacterium]|nr:response regulator [Deltaproteobacteria bacterium]
MIERGAVAATGGASRERAPWWRRVGRALRAPRPPRITAPLGLLSAPVVVGLTVLFQELVMPRPHVAPYLFFFTAVAVVSWFAGLVPGTLAVVLSALAGNFFFIAPFREWSGSPSALLATGAFCVSAEIVALLCAAFRTAFLDLDVAHDEQRRAEEALREADRRKTEFLAVLSHELRNPLAPIRNGVYILGRSPPGGEQARRALDVIDRQAAHLTRLVEDLLDVTRIARGKVRLKPERLDLSTLVRRTVDDHRAQFADRGISLDVDLPSTPIVVTGDPTRLAQVVGNLLHNAAKFTPSGGAVVVSLAVEGGKEAVVRVTDTGAGIPRDVLPHLFQPFMQADATLDRSSGGLGLGLALVRGLAELHGGSSTAASEGPGRGAEFCVRLPMASGPAAGCEPEDCAPSTATHRRVLLIDDVQDAAESLRDALAIAGHEVEIALDGPGGIAKARSFRPDAVLCDIGLPGMDGYEVARAMRAEPDLHGVLLVALTGYAGVEDAARALESGFDCHLAKPPDMAVIDRLLAGGRGAAG